MATVVWFRHDLRIEDNPALWAALERKEPLIPLFIWNPEEETPWGLGGASRWWLHHSLEALQHDLQKIGLELVLRQGKSLEVLHAISQEMNVKYVYWNRRYEPAIISRDSKIKSSLVNAGIEAQSFNAHLLYEPWTIANKQNKPFQVFTPFWKTCLAQASPPLPLGIPPKTSLSSPRIPSLKLAELHLLPTIPWDKGIKAFWKPGTAGAKDHIKKFNKKIQDYATERDRPDHAGTSLLSPYLHFGEISPRMIWHMLDDVPAYQRQLGWREFAYHLLFHFPKTPLQPLRADFEKFPWVTHPGHLHA